MSFTIGKFKSPPPSTSSNSQLESSVDQFKQRILIQNRALAKKNSFLMGKISGLESKITELIQKNIELRALNAQSEDNKRRWFEDKLNIIEEGVNQRFEEMFHMFSTIRSNEGLPPSNIRGLESTLNHNITHPGDRTVSFQTLNSPKNLQRSERRRKSLRRQSIYIAPSSPPALKEGTELEIEAIDTSSPLPTEKKYRSVDKPENQDNEDDEVDDEVHVHYSEDENPFDENSISHIEQPEEAADGQNNEEQAQDEVEIETATSFSPIKFSSPRLEELKKSSKFLVYEDSPKVQNESFQSKVEKLVSESILPESNNPESEDIITDEIEKESSDKQAPLVPESNKVKHTKSKAHKPKSSVDEQMPITAEPELSTRKSRRSKPISYAEPSLRSKMRRQSEKFVDAVVNDAFVKGVSRYDASHKNNKAKAKAQVELEMQSKNSVETTPEQSSSSSNEQEQEDEEEQIEVIQRQVLDNNKEFVDASRISPIKPKKTQKTLIEEDNRNITKRRKPLSALKQDQNKNKVAKHNSKSMNKFQSEVDESDLSVFDLVEESAAGIPKIYKGKPDILVKKKSGRRHSMML